MRAYPNATSEPVDICEKKTALEAALASEALGRSEHLRAFLAFVCQMELEGRAGELTEYLIGVKALGRPKEYSPLEDSSVRTRAHELRQKLKKFYEVEFPKAAIQIQLPRGSYAPRFVSTAAAPTVETPIVDPAKIPPNTAARKRRIPGWAIGFGAGVIIASLASWLVIVRLNLSTQVDPVVHGAWSPLLGKNSEIVVSVATPLQLLVSPYMAAKTANTPKYPVPKDLYPLFSRYRPMPADATLEMQPMQKAPLFGDVQSLALVLGVLRSLGVTPRVLPETNLPLAALGRKSAVLIGSPWYSRSVATLLERAPWTTALDPETKEIGLFGRGPQAGRKFLPRHEPTGEYAEVFGLVTVLPSDEHSRDGGAFVIFSGLTSVGTHGAAAFFTSPANIKDLMVRLKREGYAGLPSSYQVVVRCRASEDSQLLRYSYEAHQVITR